MRCTNLRRRCSTPCVSVVCCSLVLVVICVPIFPRHTLNSDTVKSVVSAVMRHKLSKQTGEFIDALKKKVEAVGAFNMSKVKSNSVDSVPGPCFGKQTEDDYQLKEVLQDVFVYSAFLDERDNDIDAKDRNRNGTHAVRIMAVLPSSRKRKNPTLYCVGLLPSGQFWSMQLYVHITQTRTGWTYITHILSCHLPRELWQTPPCSVLISQTSEPRNTSQWIKVHSSVSTVQHNIEVCVKPFFGNIVHTKLIEFIEVVRLFGADRIHFYNYQASSSIEKVLRYYKKLGIVTVLPWKLDSRLKHPTDLHSRGQELNIQDCLYRNMFSARFLAFMDVDEVFVPRNHSSWISMMLSVKNYTQTAGVIVQSAFFDPSWQRKTNRSSNVRIHRLTDVTRSKPVDRGRTKCIVNPRHVFEMTIHGIGRTVFASMKKVHLPVEIVMLHHYRNCLGDPSFCQDRIIDNTLLAYVSELEAKVKKVLATLAL